MTESFSELCKSELELIFKKSDNSPACVKPSTVQKLIDRGWGITSTFNIDKNSIDSCNVKPDPGVCKGAFEKYYFDEKTLSCKKFTWGGCDGVVPFGTLIECQTQCQAETANSVLEANNKFALQYYSQISAENDENIFFSPTSISTAFAIAYEGARGETAKEIRQVFGFSTNQDDLRKSFLNMINNLNQTDSNYKLKTANALWLAKDFQPSVEYIDIVKLFYQSKISKVDFISNEGVKTINDWTNLKTEGKIPYILDEGSTDRSTRLIITNAIYFNGTWVKQFDKNNTKNDEFSINSSEKVTVPMMKLLNTSFNYFKNDQLQILELPYKGDRLAMLILLPNEVDGIKKLERSLSIENITKWKNDIHRNHLDVIYLPKFTFETEYGLGKDLIDMGIRNAFDPKLADFSGITPHEDLFIQKAIHKAYVDVNEVGTEAAAVTAIGIGVTSAAPPPKVFRADHPFIFIIHEKENGNILFLGRVMNPVE